MTLALATGVLCTAAAHAQTDRGPRDPLSAQQAEEVREVADRPVDRLKLYLKYVNERIATIRDLSVDSTEDNRPNELHNKYEEFTRLVDELADNLDTYGADHADIRKALKAILESGAKWPDALHKAAVDKQYEFPRKTALDAAQSTIDQAKQLLADQEKYFAEHKSEAGKNGNAPSPPPPPQ